MKKLYVHTIGCQMNVYDSEKIAGLLASRGYLATRRQSEADLIVVNTCAIREKAEQKVFSYLGRLAGLKRRRKTLLVAVGGCVAQQEGDRILERQPCVDIVFGTQAIGRLPGLVALLDRGRDGTPLTLLGGVDQVVTVFAGVGLVGGNGDDVHTAGGQSLDIDLSSLQGSCAG